MIPSRDAIVSRLGQETFDLLVVGGGITGCGVIRDAARRGLNCALIEANDLASGTSSRSSKLIHGGLRYLEQWEFGLVHEAVTERQTLMRIAPHLVRAQAFLFPVYADGPHSLGFVKAGLWVYEGLSMFRSPKLHRNLRVRQVQQEEPILARDGLKGAPLYYDAATDDARLTLETALDAIRAGAAVLNHARVESLCQSAQGRVNGVRIKDALSGESLEVQAKVVVNATGPWTDRVRAMSAKSSDLLRPTKGVHIVVDADRLPVRHAVVCNHPVDKRLLFAIPWGDQSYIGTTDTDFDGDPKDVAATGEDVDYLLAACAHYFPGAELGRADVIATWAGLRPLIQDTESSQESSVSREHEIFVDENGLLTIAGGKLTTYRLMAEEVVEKAVQLMDNGVGGLVPPKTDQEPLPGAVGWPLDGNPETVAEKVRAAATHGISPEAALHLARRYGTRGIDIAASLSEEGGAPLVEGRPEVLGIVDWAIQEELAQTLEDLMVRRTQLYFRDGNQGLDVAPRIAEHMQALLGWTDARREEELSAYRAEVARSRRWREE
jgi:glycerol-3-phosphate dehydrogenase